MKTSSFSPTALFLAKQRSYIGNIWRHFFKEELDVPSSAIRSTQKRPMVRREKIVAYLARIKGAGFNPSQNVEVNRTVNKIYGGYVHGASPHLMEMYYGSPPLFQVR